MAEVWMAHRPSLGASKTVAIKLLASNLACQPEYRRMFIEEARLSMLIHNSRLVQVFEAGQDAGECYIAMEWVDGINLAQLQAGLWERGLRLPVDTAMFIAGEVLRALHYAHNLVHEGASGIIHRDVSPQNVMLSTAGEVKLADFGIARFSTEETSGLHVKGKLRYMPLEQLNGSSRGVTVDVFAVGAILHEMLEGSKFRGTSVEDGYLTAMILAGQMPELTEPGRISPELEALRRGMLMPDARQRISSAFEAVQLLSQCPGYRDMSLDLEMLVREHRTLTSEAPIVPAMPEYQTHETSVSRRREYRENPSTGTERRQGPAVIVSRQQRMAAAIIVAVLGLGVGSLGVGTAIRGILAESNEPEVMTASAEEWNWPQFDAWRVILPPEREPDVQREPERPTEPAKPKVVPPSGPPVKVAIVAGDFSDLQVKIGSKVHLVAPIKEIKLSPGRYTMRIREGENPKWLSFTVVIPKKPCRVAFKRPHTVKVIPL